MAIGEALMRLKQLPRCILLILAQLPVYSQSFLVAQILVGGGVSGNWSSLSIDNQTPGTSNSVNFGLALGADGEMRFNDAIALMARLEYLQAGTKISFPINNGVVISKTRLDYLQALLAIKASFRMNDFTIFGYVGPGFGYLLAKTNSWDYSGSIPFGYAHAEIAKTNFTAEFGTGVSYPILQMLNIFVQVQYSHGLSDISTGDLGAIRTRALHLRTGILLPL